MVANATPWPTRLYRNDNGTMTNSRLFGRHHKRTHTAAELGATMTMMAI
ncbi:MAG: hypothetical protein IPK16_01600 [Anaerolineales bacterium]|nr:hypothetical protein [Anaerolineales bacterium]